MTMKKSCRDRILEAVRDKPGRPQRVVLIEAGMPERGPSRKLITRLANEGLLRIERPQSNISLVFLAERKRRR
jgi:hypothetical protein